jgi:(1->4)-alpha-D-glucan 1-alpha-D-glucosylmutase
VNLSWINDDPAYVEALQQFVEKILSPGAHGRVNAFLEQIQAFLPAINLFGALNSLAQRLLMITAPGNPDIYRGTELWDFSLVDPDNRRPVDYQLRERLLSELDRRAEGGNLPALCVELLHNYQDGRIKLWTTTQALRLRRDHRELFHAGRYSPLEAQGPKRDHVVAFARERENEVAITAIPRFGYTLAKGQLQAPLNELWENTELAVPANTPEFMYNVFTGEKIRITPNHTLLGRELFQHFPVALLIGG